MPIVVHRTVTDTTLYQRTFQFIDFSCVYVEHEIPRSCLSVVFDGKSMEVSSKRRWKLDQILARVAG